MKKFNRKFKRILKKIKSLIEFSEYSKLIKWLYYLIQLNKEIIENKLNGNKNDLNLEKLLQNVEKYF